MVNVSKQIEALRTFRFTDDIRISGVDEDKRDDYQRDYARLVQSSAFRRLQGKSQIFGAGSGDFYRTRLTHTIEVAAIARELAGRLIGQTGQFRLNKKNRDQYASLLEASVPAFVINPAVVECGAIAHDLGHPPFGHKGEQDLDEYIQGSRKKKSRGYRFESNAQNFRLLMFLQSHYDGKLEPNKRQNQAGLDLTAAVLLATNKYPYSLGTDEDRFRPSDATNDKKGVYPSEWADIDRAGTKRNGLLRIRNDWGIPRGLRTLEAQIVDISDDIAYSSHDVEDGFRAGKIRFSDFERDSYERNRIVGKVVEEIRRDFSPQRDTSPFGSITEESLTTEVNKTIDVLSEKWAEYARAGLPPSLAISGLQKYLVTDALNRVGIVDDPSSNWKKVTFVTLGDREREDEEFLRRIIVIKRIVYCTIVLDMQVQRLQRRGERILRELWNMLVNSDIHHPLVPPEWTNRYHEHSDHYGWERFIADYVSGMTDSYAERIYRELSGSGFRGSIFDIE